MWAVERHAGATKNFPKREKKKIRVSMGHRSALEKKKNRKKKIALKAFASSSSLSRSFIRRECAPHSRGFLTHGSLIKLFALSTHTTFTHDFEDAIDQSPMKTEIDPPARRRHCVKTLGSTFSERCLDRDEGNKNKKNMPPQHSSV